MLSLRELERLQLPKKLSGIPRDLRELGQHSLDFSRDTVELLSKLREDYVGARELIEALQAGGGGGGSVAFGSPIALTVGGSNADGTSSNAARADHKHELPAFGTSAGTFAQGNHTHAGLGSTYVDEWEPRSNDYFESGVPGSWSYTDPGTLSVSSTGTDAALKSLYAHFTIGAFGTGMATIGWTMPAPAAATEPWQVILCGSSQTPGPGGEFFGLGVCDTYGGSHTMRLCRAEWGATGGTVNEGTSTSSTQYTSAATKTNTRAAFLRIRSLGTEQFLFDYSLDGFSWDQIRQSATPAPIVSADAAEVCFLMGTASSMSNIDARVQFHGVWTALHASPVFLPGRLVRKALP